MANKYPAKASPQPSSAPYGRFFDILEPKNPSTAMPQSGKDAWGATSSYQVERKAAYEKEQADLLNKEYNDWLGKGGSAKLTGIPLMPSQKARLEEQERQAYFANRPPSVAVPVSTEPTLMREDDFKAMYGNMMDPTQMYQLTSTGQYTNPQAVDAAVKQYASRPTAMPQSGKDAWGKPANLAKNQNPADNTKDYLEMSPDQWKEYNEWRKDKPAGFYSNSPTWSGGTLNTNNTPSQQSPPPSTTNLSSTMPAPSPYRSAPTAPPPTYAAMQSPPPQRSQSESKFSEGFLNYLDQARTMKLRQGEMNIEKTGAETGLLGVQTGRLASMTPYEIAQIAAQTGLTGAQTSRINTLTPYEAAQMSAQTGLYGAQANLAGTQAARTETLTPYEAAQMRAETGLTGAQTGRINTLTPYEAAQMAAQTSRINTLTPYEAAQMGAQTGRINTLTPYEAAQMAAQTGRINTLTPYEAAQMAAQTGRINTLTPYEAAEIGSRMNLTNAQTSRLAAITPYEIQQIIAGNQLTGAQADNFKAKTLSEYGMTPTGMANIFATNAAAQQSLMSGKASLMNAYANLGWGGYAAEARAGAMASPATNYFSPVSSSPYSSGSYTTT